MRCWALTGAYWFILVHTDSILVPYQFLLVHTGLVAAPHQQHGAQPLCQHLQELHICRALRKTPKPPLFAPFSLFPCFSPISPFPTPFSLSFPSSHPIQPHSCVTSPLPSLYPLFFLPDFPSFSPIPPSLWQRCQSLVTMATPRPLFPWQRLPPSPRCQGRR